MILTENLIFVFFVISVIFSDWKLKFGDSKLRSCNVHIVQQYLLFIINGSSYGRNWFQLDFQIISHIKFVDNG